MSAMKLGNVQKQTDLVRLRREGKGIACIEMLDAAGKNAFTAEFVGALLAALEETHADPECAAVILSGTEQFFCAGAAKQLLLDLKAQRIAPAELLLSEKLLRHSSVIIAAAAGSAIGGGFALVVAADQAVIAEESRYGFNFMRHGITPGMGVTRLAEDYLGRPFAHQLLYSGDIPKGSAFRHCPIEVLPKAAVLERAYQLAYGVAANPARNVALLKRTLAFPRLKACQEASLLESLMHETSLQTLDLEGWSEK